MNNRNLVQIENLRNVFQIEGRLPYEQILLLLWNEIMGWGGGNILGFF